MTDERDLRDPALDGAWRAHVRDAPPAALDDAILAAAHRAVGSGPQSTVRPAPRWRAWAPLAVAATLGAIALGVVQLAPHEEDATRATISEAPAALRAPTPREPVDKLAATPAPAQSTPPQAPAPAAADAPRPNVPFAASSPVERRQGASARGKAVAPAPAPRPEVAPRAQAPAPVDRVSATTAPPPAAAPAEPMREGLVDSRKDELASLRKDRAAPAPQPFPAAPRVDAQRAEGPRSDASRDLAAGAGAIAAAPPPASVSSVARERGAGNAMQAKVANARSPDDFVRDIRKLRAEGHDADAALALAAFRAAYIDADERLPDDLRAWARGVAHP